MHTHTLSLKPLNITPIHAPWFWSTYITNVLNLLCCIGFFLQEEGSYFIIQDTLTTDPGI